MNYVFKQLGSSDILLLKKLLVVFSEAFDDMKTYQEVVPDDKYIGSLLGKSHIVSLVALYDGEVVGGLVAYELEKFEQERREIYIYDIAVSEQHRRKGVANNLIRELKRIARERAAYVIFVQADRGDSDAIRLSKSFGTREDVHHFNIPVNQK